MKKSGFIWSTLHFLRNALIMIIVNMIIVYLISRFANSSTSEGYGRIMILYGCLYMLLGFGSVVGGTKLRTNMATIYSESLSGKSMREYAANGVLRFDKNLGFTLHAAFTGAMTLGIGLIIFNLKK